MPSWQGVNRVLTVALCSLQCLPHGIPSSHIFNFPWGQEHLNFVGCTAGCTAGLEVAMAVDRLRAIESQVCGRAFGQRSEALQEIEKGKKVQSPSVWLPFVPSFLAPPRGAGSAFADRAECGRGARRFDSQACGRRESGGAIRPWKSMGPPVEESTKLL